MKKLYLPLLAAVLWLFLLPSLFGPNETAASQKVYAAEKCPVIRDGTRESASPEPNTGALHEKETAKCSGIIGQFLCKFIASILNFFYGPQETTLTLGSTDMPEDLVHARTIALSGEGGDASGFIARMLPPQYREEDEGGSKVDPIKSLTKSEGQLVEGYVVLNGEEPADVYGEVDPGGTYTVETKGGIPSYKLKTRFGEVAALFDRYSFLQRSFVPGASDEFKLPETSVDCSLSEQTEPGPITILDSTRGIRWDATKDLPSGMDSGDPDCSPGNGDDGICNGSKDFDAYGDLGTTTEISLVGEAWQALAGKSSTPGESGVLNILLPPGWRFKSEDSTEPKSPTRYDAATAIGGVSSTSTLPIAKMGAVKGALDCITQQLTETPAYAAYGTCEQWLINDLAGEFSGWPTEHGCITQGANTDGTHARTEAIDIASNSSVPGWGNASDIFGKPIMATHAGNVESSCDDAGGCGNPYGGKWVSVRSSDGGFASQYWHLSATYVGTGEPVSPGTVVGAMGYTGNVIPKGLNGTHLHYELKGTTISGNTPEEVPQGCIGRFQCNLCW